MCWQIFQKNKIFKKLTRFSKHWEFRKCSDKFPKKLKISKNDLSDFSKNWIIWKMFWQISTKNENFEKYFEKFPKNENNKKVRTNFPKTYKFYKNDRIIEIERTLKIVLTNLSKNKNVENVLILQKLQISKNVPTNFQNNWKFGKRSDKFIQKLKISNKVLTNFWKE